MIKQTGRTPVWSSLLFATPRLTALAMLVFIAAAASAFLSICRQPTTSLPTLFATPPTSF